MEHVVVVVEALLLVDHDHAVVLHRLAAAEDGADGRQGRHVPLDVAPRVVRGGLHQRPAVLDVQNFEGHLAVWICAKVTGTKGCSGSGRRGIMGQDSNTNQQWENVTAFSASLMRHTSGL